MNLLAVLYFVTALAPAALMLLAGWLPRSADAVPGGLWRRLAALSALACVAAVVVLGLQFLFPAADLAWPGWAHWVATDPLAALLAVLVQFLGTVIVMFSARYLEGEPRQARYIRALAFVLAAVHLLLLSNHWLLLIATWAAVGVALQQLLCFYPERPFAQLAAHKKHLADRLADVLLLAAAALAWSAVGSGSFADLWQHLDAHGATAPLQWSAVLLALAVILRTALLPVHGWLIQVMEAPTPVSALLHAGVVNLGGFVLIRFAPLWDAAASARWLLVVAGLSTAVLAGLVLLTRISIKVRLAWSTVAQMGFMVLECGLGLYTFAVLHLIGHSLYKAHTFLSASAVVQQTRVQMMMGHAPRASLVSLLCAPLLALVIVTLVQAPAAASVWPWWWSALLALAWAPLLWLPANPAGSGGLPAWRTLAGLAMIAGLTLLARLVHLMPLGLRDQPHESAGLVALLGMAVLYLALITLRRRAELLEGWRRWSYAGFYVDEFYTRLALRLWPANWAPEAARINPPEGAQTTALTR
jgi:NAD(P)H-quinone oxidoreductase subunit 5